MRVTGGELAGRRFAAARGAEVRPTSDRVRESLFARLGELRGCAVLDLYAGSGALGIEALSRGAARVVFVDGARRCVAQVRRNLASLGLGERGRVRHGDAVGTLLRLAAAGRRFDLVLADPPYASGEARRVLRAVGESGILARGGALVLEVSRRHPPGESDRLRLQDARRYGDTLVVRYVVRDPGGAAGEPVVSGDSPGRDREGSTLRRESPGAKGRVRRRSSGAARVRGRRGRGPATPPGRTSRR